MSPTATTTISMVKCQLLAQRSPQSLSRFSIGIRHLSFDLSLPRYYPTSCCMSWMTKLVLIINTLRNVSQNRVGTIWLQNEGIKKYTSPAAFLIKTSHSEVTTGNAKLILTWKFPKQIEFQLSNVYYAPDIIPQGKVRERYSLDFGLKKISASGLFEWRLSTTDLINTFQIRKEITGTNFNLTANNYYETQVVTWGMKYKF